MKTEEFTNIRLDVSFSIFVLGIFACNIFAHLYKLLGFNLLSPLVEDRSVHLYKLLGFNLLAI